MFKEISFDSRTICEFDVNPSSVYASGISTCACLNFKAEPYRLSPLQLTSNGEKHYSVISHDLGLYLGKSKKYGGSYISPISCKGFPIRSWWSHNSQIELYAPIDYFKMDALESGREKDIKLYISGSVMLALHNFEASTKREYCLQIDGYVEAEFNLMYNIAQSDWIRNVFSKLGHRKFYLLELDLSSCEIKKALEYISEAEAAVSEARYVHAAIRCRDLMAYLEVNYLKLGDSKENEKWKRIRAYFNHFASIAGHQEDLSNQSKQDVIFNRDDAEMVVNLTKLIVRYVQLLKDGR